MGLELKRGLELFFQKKLKLTINHLLVVFFRIAPLLLMLKEHF
jgi:hypothetical protein